MGISSVIIDSREPEWVQQLSFSTGLAAIAPLPAGDLMIMTDSEDALLVERKTASDLLNTLRDDRLFPQVAKMVETTTFAYLAICGQLQPGPEGKVIADGRESGWAWASLQGALLTIQEMGVHILYVSSDHDYEQSIIRLANRDRTSKKIQPARDATLVSEREIILGSLPGIGPEKIQDILETCKTPAWALAFLSDDESIHNISIPGIAAGTKRRIRKALELPDWAMLSVVHKDFGEGNGNIPSST